MYIFKVLMLALNSGAYKISQKSSFFLMLTFDYHQLSQQTTEPSSEFPRLPT